jgi:hypothetical protein
LDDDDDEDMVGGFKGKGYMEDKVTMERWARNRRQKVLRDISFESGPAFNIYDPHFTSEEEEKSEMSYQDIEDAVSIEERSSIADVNESLKMTNSEIRH